MGCLLNFGLGLGVGLVWRTFPLFFIWRAIGAAISAFLLYVLAVLLLGILDELLKKPLKRDYILLFYYGMEWGNGMTVLIGFNMLVAAMVAMR